MNYKEPLGPVCEFYEAQKFLKKPINLVPAYFKQI